MALVADSRPVPTPLLPHLRRARDHIDRHFNTGNWLVLVEPKEYAAESS